MAYPYKIHDPQAVLDYEWRWRAEGWLAEDDDIISASFTVATADGADIPDTDTTPVEVDSFSNTTDNVTAWISGGTAGTNYLVVCHIVTSGGREDDRSLLLKVQQR